MLKTTVVFILLINEYVYFKKTFPRGEFILFTLAATLVTDISDGF